MRHRSARCIFVDPLATQMTTMSTDAISVSPHDAALSDAIAWTREVLADPERETLPEERVDLASFTPAQIEALLMEAFGERRFRASQVTQWLFERLVQDFSAMTNVSQQLRARFERTLNIEALKFDQSHEAADGTVKLAFKCRDNAVIETVYIPSEGRNTLCISSQVGCAMGCTFCWTAKMGLRRNLTAAEIVGQVMHARRLMGERNGHIGNIVFMGMGEPLHNYDNVLQAIRVLTDEAGLNFSRRKITVSTSGLVPQIRKLGHDADVNLAISLNGTTDAQRGAIMPVNDRWNIEALMDALREYPLERRQRLTFEYVLIRDLNDTLDDARRLVKLMRGVKGKVNLIPFNPHPHTPFQTPDEATIDAFQQHLVANHVNCFRRVTRGQEEMAACGQLGKPGDRKEPPHLRKRLELLRGQLATKA